MPVHGAQRGNRAASRSRSAVRRAAPAEPAPRSARQPAPPRPRPVIESREVPDDIADAVAEAVTVPEDEHASVEAPG